MKKEKISEPVKAYTAYEKRLKRATEISKWSVEKIIATAQDARNNSFWDRKAAINALEDRKDEASTEIDNVLYTASKDPNIYIRIAAVRALAKRKSKKSTRALIDVINAEWPDCQFDPGSIVQWPIVKYERANKVAAIDALTERKGEEIDKALRVVVAKSNELVRVVEKAKTALIVRKKLFHR